MKATELLVSVSVGNLYIARMEDGSFRWVSMSMQLLPGGPDAGWVERGLTAKAASLHGAPNTQRPIAHDILLNTLNANIV
jgi:hypothetical protein